MAVEGPWAQTWLPRHCGTQQASLWVCGVAGRGLEASGSASLTAPGRWGQCGPETIQSRAVLHVQELGVTHCCHSSAGTPRGQSPAGAFLRWPACVTPRHVLQVCPRCYRFPCVLRVNYGCDSPIVWADPLSICGGSACLRLPVAGSPTSSRTRCVQPLTPNAPLPPPWTMVDWSCPHAPSVPAPAS